MFSDATVGLALIALGFLLFSAISYSVFIFCVPVLIGYATIQAISRYEASRSIRNYDFRHKVDISPIIAIHEENIDNLNDKVYRNYLKHSGLIYKFIVNAISVIGRPLYFQPWGSISLVLLSSGGLIYSAPIIFDHIVDTINNVGIEYILNFDSRLFYIHLLILLCPFISLVLSQFIKSFIGYSMIVLTRRFQEWSAYLFISILIMAIFISVLFDPLYKHLFACMFCLSVVLSFIPFPKVILNVKKGFKTLESGLLFLGMEEDDQETMIEHILPQEVNHLTLLFYSSGSLKLKARYLIFKEKIKALMNHTNVDWEIKKLHAQVLLHLNRHKRLIKLYSKYVHSEQVAPGTIYFCVFRAYYRLGMIRLARNTLITWRKHFKANSLPFRNGAYIALALTDLAILNNSNDRFTVNIDRVLRLCEIGFKYDPYCAALHNRAAYSYYLLIGINNVQSNDVKYKYYSEAAQEHFYLSTIRLTAFKEKYGIPPDHNYNSLLDTLACLLSLNQDNNDLKLSDNILETIAISTNDPEAKLHWAHAYMSNTTNYIKAEWILKDIEFQLKGDKSNYVYALTQVALKKIAFLAQEQIIVNDHIRTWTTSDSIPVIAIAGYSTSKGHISLGASLKWLLSPQKFDVEPFDAIGDFIVNTYQSRVNYRILPDIGLFKADIPTTRSKRVRK